MSLVTVNTLDLSRAPEAISILEAVGKLVSLPPDRRDVLAAMREADAYLASASVIIDEEFLASAPRLRVIGSPSTGTDHMDLAAIDRRGIVRFDISREYELINSFSATSELAFGLLLALIRKLKPALSAAERGDWARERYTGFQLLGKTLGILGLGRLGAISARIGHGFGMKVIACDTKPKAVPNVTMVDFQTLLRQSDVLTVHIHLTPETDGIIGPAAFEQMKPTAILLNTSRGRIVDETALLAALQSGRIAGAGLDVIDGEWLSDDERYHHPLVAYARDNESLLISPHIGGATTESIYGARIFMAKKIADWLRQATPVAAAALGHASRAR
jgi:D-3-phosphoglycerate dehydrogenase